MQNNDARVFIWKLETIVGKLVLQSTYGTKSTYLDRGYNLFTKYHGHHSNETEIIR